MIHRVPNCRARRWYSVIHSTFLAALVHGICDTGAQAGIIAINTPGSSNASITFDDTNSSTPPSGATNSGPSVSPWSGATLTLASTTDPNTGDIASGSIDGTFIFSSNTYALNFSGVTLNQIAGNTGYATLDFAFNIEFQLDALGLPSQATLYPNFVVNGTVQSSAGSFASVSGYIDYLGVTTAGTIGVLDTVKYGSSWTTPGPFSGTAVGIPSIGTTPALVGNTTLTLTGMITFTVDPASINAYSVQSTPEPSAWALVCLGVGGVLAGAVCRRSNKSPAISR